MNTTIDLYKSILKFAVLLALIVVVLGAYTRLSDAGLGCPDWPGCYGHIGVPEQLTDSKFDRPLEQGKAWKEMIHRYVAGTLGIVILLVLALVVFRKPRIHQPIFLPIILLLTVIFQALLGMWTVTMLLSPVIVSAHLIGGFTTLSMIWWLLLNQFNPPSTLTYYNDGNLKSLAVLGLLLIVLQILLGGWTSTNYAALACGADFPTCAKQWWPTMDFASAFNISHSAGTNYEFGTLEAPARTAIQVAHRIGALVVFIYFLALGIKLLRFSAGRHKGIGLLLLLLLFTQVGLGITNVLLGLPIAVAVAHNLVAALLLLTVLAICHKTCRGQ
ncbi:MAG: COX15/CtaA family protein [Thiotrichaceae bacterium]